MAKSAANSTYSPSHQKFLKQYYRRKRSIRILQLLIIIIFLTLWEVTTRIGWVDSFIFSSPSRVAGTFLTMAADGTIFYHTGITLLETFVSFAIVNIFGIAIAILLWWNDRLAKVLEPYLVVLNSLPKSALAPVFIVWLGNNVKTIIVAAVSVETVLKLHLL